MIYLILTWVLAPIIYLRLLFVQRTNPPKKILLIQTAKIGDFICTTPLILALRQSFPSAKLQVLVNPVVESLAKNQPYIDQVTILKGGKISGITDRLTLYKWFRRESFDMTICISPNLLFLLLPFLARISTRAAILPNYSGNTLKLAKPFANVTEQHQSGQMTVETGFKLIKQLGIQIDLPPKRIEYNSAVLNKIKINFPILLKEGRWIGIGISSGNKLKELGQEKITTLILGTINLPDISGVVLIGSGNDKPLAEKIAKAINSDRIIDTTGTFQLDEIPALLDLLILYAGVDSGITYMADARNIPVVDIMGPADHHDQRPTGENATLILSDEPCAPCSHAFKSPYFCTMGTKACIKNVNIQKILTITQEIIRK